MNINDSHANEQCKYDAIMTLVHPIKNRTNKQNKKTKKKEKNHKCNSCSEYKKRNCICTHRNGKLKFIIGML